MIEILDKTINELRT